MVTWQFIFTQHHYLCENKSKKQNLKKKNTKTTINNCNSNQISFPIYLGQRSLVDFLGCLEYLGYLGKILHSIQIKKTLINKNIQSYLTKM